MTSVNENLTPFEWMCVIYLVFFMVIAGVLFFGLPLILDKYVGNDIEKLTGYSSIPEVNMESGIATLEQGKQVRFSMTPSLLTSEEINVSIDNSEPGMKLVKIINSGHWLLWTPQERGVYKITVTLDYSTKKEIKEWTFFVK
jgi:hypothetical protein